MNNEQKEKVVKTKKMMWKGKAYTAELTEKQYNDMRKDAEVCKLNGHNFDYFLNQMLTSWMRDEWPEVAASVFNEVDPVLAVGMGATMNLWSDRRAMTIVQIVTPKKIVVRENQTKCIDYYGSRYEILDELEGGTTVFTLRKNGTWVEEGQPKKFGSVTLTVGFRHHYIDPSF